MNNKIFFKEQLLRTLNNSLVEQIFLDNMTFVILPSDDDNEKPKNTWDEIINWWVLPTSTDVKLSLDQVVETLTSRQALLPLWIKVKQQSKDLILLNISRRFRRLKDIKEFHKDNENMPFIFDNSIEFEFTNEIQKIGLTRNEKNILTTMDIGKILDTYLDKEMNYRIDNITINK